MRKGIHTVARYSGWAFQMILLVLLSAFAGKWLDGYFDHATPWFTIVLCLVSIIGSLFLFLRNFLRDSNK